MSAKELERFPDREALLTTGTQVFLVLHKDPLRERIDVRVSSVLQLEGDVLFVAQTEPPVRHDQGGQQVEVALLVRSDDEARRPLGYVARLLDVREDYPSDEGQGQALALSAPNTGDFFETSLRMHYRVPVEEDMGVSIRLEGFEDPELLDFSAGGARVRIAAGPEGLLPDIDLGQAIPFRLLFLGSGYAAGDGVVRSLEFGENNESITVGLFFTNMEIRDIRYLERMVARTVSSCRQRERDADYV